MPLADLLKKALANKKQTTALFQEFLQNLMEKETNRPPVLFAFDQINCFYSKTAYFDSHSLPLTSDRLQPIHVFQKLFRENTSVSF
jgi:hypothetical protein